MKKRKYKPRPIRVDALSYVINGFKPLSSVGNEAISLKNKNSIALEVLFSGLGDKSHVDVLVAALNMTEALARLRIGDEYNAEINAGQNALFNMACRGVRHENRFVFTMPERQAISLAMDIHDAQLDICTIGELETALEIVQKVVKNKKAREIA
jgi:hypothetical protein